MTTAAERSPPPRANALSRDERRAGGVACGAHALHDGYTDLIYVLLPVWQTEFGLGYCANGSMSGRIVIPIHNADGQLVAYAGRWPSEPAEGTPKYKLPVGFRKSLELFNLHRAVRPTTEQPLVIVEGFFDCIKLWQHGVKRVLALMGSTLSPAQEELLRKHTNSRSQILLMLDEDDAGRAAREQILPRLARFAFVKVHSFDEEGQQPEDLSTEALAEILEGLP